MVFEQDTFEDAFDFLHVLSPAAHACFRGYTPTRVCWNRHKQGRFECVTLVLSAQVAMNTLLDPLRSIAK